MSNDCKRPTVYGRIPTSADPFGLMLGQQVQHLPRLRYEGEGGTGEGAGGSGSGSGGDGGDGGEGGDQPLGAAGQRALEQERAKRAEARRERDEARTSLEAFTSLGLTPEQVRALVDEKDPNNPERIRRDAEKAATKAADARMATTLRRGAIRAAAVAGGFQSADDVLALIPGDDVDKLDVNLETAVVDPTAVQTLLDTLATQKPYLKGTPAPTADHRAAGIGASGTTGASAEPTPGMGRLRVGYSKTSQ